VKRGAAALLLFAAAGCVTAGGRSRTFDQGLLASEQGWLAAAPPRIVWQAGSKDCGPAALAMVAAHWSVALSLDEAVLVLPAAEAKDGARLGDLRDLARARGLRAYVIAGDREVLVHELGAGRPVLVGVFLRKGLRGATQHYEVVTAVHATDHRIVSIDPASGWRVRSWADFEAEWSPAGSPALVVVGRSEAAPVSAADGAGRGAAP